MSEERKYGIVEFRLECLIEKSSQEGKVWAKPLEMRGVRYLIDEDRVDYDKEGYSR